MSTEQAPPKTPFESVDIKSVSYSINSFSESPIINNVNFSMKKGEWLVLSGKSGAGKTTLCKLLAGIIAPSAGKIVWNNIEQQQIDVSFMLQDSKLIQGTILDNITLHDDSIPFADVVKACELAELHHTIMAMPSGYRTLVGEGVGGLSGGQRQRLLLARAALRQCSLLILDEFSNNLDDETTVSILRNLKNRFDSIIFVSHSEHVIASACRRIMWDELKRVRAAA